MPRKEKGEREKNPFGKRNRGGSDSLCSRDLFIKNSSSDGGGLEPAATAAAVDLNHQQQQRWDGETRTGDGLWAATRREALREMGAVQLDSWNS
ncbi:hypothetical protein RIF29_16564 [Crotalaria pallida]|uniref:Uncharacterized protein n=1 Tax=Crotalaria pallida TaxID=3830 RepID=A0AAN9FFK7_CROPI